MTVNVVYFSDNGYIDEASLNCIR